jgi:hypothetical protein
MCQPSDKVACVVFWYVCHVTELHAQGCGMPTHYGQYNVLARNVELFPIFISLIPVVIYTRIAIKIDEKLYLHSKLIVTISGNS